MISKDLSLSRRTRRSIRPAACRVSDRTMVRVTRPSARNRPRLDPRKQRRGAGTMRKKTARPRPKQRKASTSKKSGLIAKEKTTGSSARAKSVLDNRSHRTTNEYRLAAPRLPGGRVNLVQLDVRHLEHHLILRRRSCGSRHRLCLLRPFAHTTSSAASSALM